MRRILLIASLLLLGAVHAQDAHPLARIDTPAVLIGQQAHLWLSITYRADKGTTIVWPAIADTLTGHVEIVHDSGVDTVMPDKKDPYLLKQARTLTITSWDSGYWAIPPFRFVINGDTVPTDPLLFSVNTMSVDTTQAIRDIKGLYEVQYGFMDWLRDHWRWIAIGAGAAILAVIIILILVRRARRPKQDEAPPAPEIPLHQRTLAALEAVGAKKLWQQGLAKQHHTEITDILRGYIEQRYGISALERTTDELVAALRPSAMPQAERERLANLLRLADLVKFAKYTALPAENEQVLEGAITLVRNTAQPLTDAAGA